MIKQCCDLKFLRKLYSYCLNHSVEMNVLCDQVFQRSEIQKIKLTLCSPDHEVVVLDRSDNSFGGDLSQVRKEIFLIKDDTNSVVGSLALYDSCESVFAANEIKEFVSSLVIKAGPQKRMRNQKKRNEFKVLIVDDNFDICETLSDHLQYLGYKPEFLTCALEAKEYFESCYFDLIISDVRMPHFDGLSLLKSLRSCPQRAGTKFIFITGIGEEEEDFGRFGLLYDAILHKPFLSEDLENTVEEVLTSGNY